MALPRPSNTGILIGAVFVAALGLGANFFMQLNPELIASILPSAPKAAADFPTDQKTDASAGPLNVEHFESAAEVAPPKTAKQIKACMQELTSLENSVRAAHDRWEKYGVLPNEYREALDRICHRAISLSNNVTDSSAAEEELKRAARLSALSIAFFSAQMDGQTASKVFDAVSAEVMNASTIESDRARTAVLQFLIHHDLRHPQEDQLLEDLQAFGDEFDSPANDIFLHETIARELSHRGFINISNRVLTHGILRYRDNGSVNRLISMLIGQGGSVPR